MARTRWRRPGRLSRWIRSTGLQVPTRQGRDRSQGRGRGWSAWVPLLIGVVMLVIIGTGVLAPILGLISAGVGAMSTVGATAEFVHVPTARITVVAILGFVVAAALVLVSVRSRSGVIAWLLVGVGLLVALAVSLYPIVAVAFAAVGDVHQIVPWIRGFIARIGH